MFQRLQRYLIIALVVIVFLAFMVTYTVRFTEKAIVTTFGRAGPNSVVAEPGLKFKIPFVQQVTKYDTRTRFVESTQETQQTRDDRQILVTAFVTWRVENPLEFFQSFSAYGRSSRDHYEAANNVLRDRLRSSLAEIARFRLDELLAPVEGGSQLAALERQVLARMGGEGGAASSLPSGIRLQAVGISRLGLPADTTRAVFERMNQERLKIANDAKARGEAQAQAIRSEADSAATKITAFAERLAQRIRQQGDQEAAQYIAQMKTNPELAVFLQQMEFMRNAYGRSTTLVFPTSMAGFDLMRPDAPARLQSGRTPLAAMSILGEAVEEIEARRRDAAPASEPGAAAPDTRDPQAAAAPAGGQQ